MEFETKRLKSELFSLDFRQCLKLGLFGNGTISKSAKIRTFRFQAFTVCVMNNNKLEIHPRGMATFKKIISSFSPLPPLYFVKN